LQTVRKFLVGFVVLALSIAIPASISASWFIYALWIAIGVALVLLIVFSDSLQRLLPWRLERKNPGLEAVISVATGQFLLRHDLQDALRRVNGMQNPKPAELRAFADNVAQRLRDAGHDEMARRIAVQLGDDASPQAVENRRVAVRDELAQSLIWDNYA
jgi:hypothetical protein